MLSEAKHLKATSTSRAADDTPGFVILNEVKDLTTQSTAREILRSAQDDGENGFDVILCLTQSRAGLLWVLRMMNLAERNPD